MGSSPAGRGGCCVHAKLPGLGHRYFKDEIHPALKHSVGRPSFQLGSNFVGIPAIPVDIGASRLPGMVSQVNGIGFTAEVGRCMAELSRPRCFLCPAHVAS